MQQATLEQIPTTPPSPSQLSNATKAEFRARGYAELPDLWTRSTADALAEEAHRLFPEATDPDYGPRTPVASHRASGKVTRVASGPVLRELHASLASLVRSLSGRMLVGSFANYGYYPLEDGVILHADTEATEVVLLTTVLGSLGPLSIRPELQGRTPKELGECESDPYWNRDGGEMLSYPALGAAALRGALLPHHRVSRPVPTLSAVAALHYRSPFLPMRN
jgi:hypothetical protein